MMMNFLDLSAASEEECRLIREILSDTSVVNIAEPQSTLQLVVPNTTTTVPLETSNIITQQSYQHHAKQQGQKSQQHSTRDHQQHDQQHGPSSISSVVSETSQATPSSQPDNLKLAIKSQTLASAASSIPTNAHQLPIPQNGSDIEAFVKMEDTSEIAQASMQNKNEASVTIVSVNNGQHQQEQQQYHMTHNPQTHHQHMNGQRQSFKNNPNQQMNFSNNGNNGHNNNSPTSGSAAHPNHRSNYNNQRKNIHNSNNNNSIGNNNSSNRNTRLSSLGNVANNMQQHYPHQYTSQHPSNVSSSTHYHSINVNNINNHSANALNSQLNQQHQRSNELSNDRRSGISHLNNNNDIIVVTSASGLATLAPNLDHHHGNTMPSNVYNQHTAHMHHQVPPVMSTAKLDPKSSNLKNQAYHPQDTSTSIQNTTTGTQSVPSSAQMPPMAGDMNSVIGMDMTSTQPPGYAIPSHVTTFGPPPHHVYGGPPIFQSYLNHYLIPYNIPYTVPYVLPPNSVVPTRQQIPPQSNQPPSTSTTSSSHHRPHSHHIPQPNHELYSNVNNSQTNQQSSKDENAPNKDLVPLYQSQNLKKINSEKELAENHKVSPGIKVSTNVISTKNDSRSSLQKSEKVKKPPQEVESLQEVDSSTATEVKSSSQEQSNTSVDKPSKVVSNMKAILKNGPSTANKNKNLPIVRGDRTENQLQKADPDSASSHHNTTKNQPLSKNVQLDNNRDSTKHQDSRVTSTTNKANSEDLVKLSSDEGFDTQSSLDVSKQSQESSIPTNDHSKSSPETCNKSVLEKTSRDLTESKDIKTNEVLQRAGGVWASASSRTFADLFKGGGGALLGSSVNGETGHNNLAAGNSGEEKKNPRSNSTKGDTNIKVDNLVSTLNKEHRSQQAAKRALDKMAPRLAQKINSITLKHSLPFLKPLGFINKGNGCYINATLQALIACPPFYNLMKEVGDLRGFRRENSCTPILDSFAELFLNFPPLDTNKKNKQSTSQDQKLHINYLQAEAIEPKCIYYVLGQIKSECLKGAQEDAEEFLSSVLNGLHEEMIGLDETLQPLQDLGTQNGQSNDIGDSSDDIANDDNLWREVGPKNRSLPIRTAKVINTPIQEIFGGSLFSIRTAGRDRCGHRSPFFDLQLDISGDIVESVQDAIMSFTAPEIIHDFYCSKTKQKLDAQRRTSLDQLPPILILHLKQFVYTQDHGLKKLMKKIEYPIDLELPENCLHEKNYTDKSFRTSRSYKLLAVVYHDGKEAIKGHYLTDVYHIGSSQWIRCDDSNLKVISSPRIENLNASRTPYLLFYRRLNTLRAQIGNHDSKKKS